MKAATYEIEAANEATHWWFVGRRVLFNRVIQRLGVPPNARILDIGTSTGGNLRMLKDAGFSRAEGLDLDDEAIRWCVEKRLGPVRKGDICDIPFADQSFDLVLATDVIEHVEDDTRALSEIYRVLKPGACAIITVPAFQLLWGLEDEASQHKRRYRGSDITALITASGLIPDESFYFNYFLFLPILLMRTALRTTNHSVRSEIEINSPLTNRLLSAVFRWDVATAPVIKPPFGVSFLVTARRS